MEAEKAYQNKVVRTIQQKRNSEGTLGFTDNRPTRNLQDVAEAIQRPENGNEILQGEFENTLQRQEDDEAPLQSKSKQSIQREEDDEETCKVSLSNRCKGRTIRVCPTT